MLVAPWCVLTLSVLLVSASPGAYLVPPLTEKERMRLFNERSFAIATVWQEARGIDYQGKLNVASVIRNRMAKKYASDGTLVGTVLRDRQFSGWNNVDPNRLPSLRIDDSDPVVAECVKAWAESESKDTVSGAVLYYAKTMPAAPFWARPSNSKIVAEDKGHIFLIPRPVTRKET